jgi:hypothetical protein
LLLAGVQPAPPSRDGVQHYTTSPILAGM